MKFSIEKSAFVNGLQKVTSVVEQRAMMPILSNVLIECCDNALKITATNLDISINCKVRANVERSGRLTLPAKKLLAIVRSLPSDDVTVDVDGTKAKIASGRSNFQIMGLSADEFPAVQEQAFNNTIKLGQSDMARMLKYVSFAQSTDDNRFILNSVYFCFENEKMTLAATDGRRLSLVSHKIDNAAELTGVVVPSKAVRELEKILGQGDDVEFSFDKKQISFAVSVKDDNKDGLVGDIRLMSKIIDGNYPNFRQIIPQTTENRVKIDRQLVLECIQRVAIVASDQKNLVKLHFKDNTLEISAESQEYGEAHEKVAIEYTGNPVEIAFNYMFLCDPLKVLTQDEVFFEFKDELSAGVIKTIGDFLYVVMPLRLG